MEREPDGRSSTARRAWSCAPARARSAAGRRLRPALVHPPVAGPDARLRSAFLSLAESITRAADVPGYLTAVIDACAELVGADAGVAALADGGQRMHVVARTAPTATPGRRSDALLHVVPMRIGEDVLGRLVLFGGSPGPGRADRDALQAFVDVATPQLLEGRLLLDARSMPAAVRRALESRTLTARAERVLTARWHLAAGDARRALHHLAGRSGRPVPDVARRIVDSAQPPRPAAVPEARPWADVDRMDRVRPAAG